MCERAIQVQGREMQVSRLCHIRGTGLLSFRASSASAGYFSATTVRETRVPNSRHVHSKRRRERERGRWQGRKRVFSRARERFLLALSRAFLPFRPGKGRRTKINYSFVALCKEKRDEEDLATSSCDKPGSLGRVSARTRNRKFL